MSPEQQPIITLFDVPNMNQAQYDGIIRGLEAAGAGSIPARLYHVAGPNGDGWIVVDVWRSTEDFTKFAETLMPLVQQIGVTPPQPRVLPVHNIIVGGGEQNSTQAMLTLVKQAQQQFNAGNIEGYLETLYAPNAVLHFLPPGLPQGHEGASLFYGAFLAAFADVQFIIDDTAVDGDRMTVRYHLDMTHQGEFQGIPATGKRVILNGITILRFAGGKVVERWNEADFMGLMAQLSAVSPSGAPIT